MVGFYFSVISSKKCLLQLELDNEKFNENLAFVILLYLNICV